MFFTSPFSSILGHEIFHLALTTFNRPAIMTQQHNRCPSRSTETVASPPTTALERCAQARQLWLAATTLEELDEVEGLYKAALNATASGKNSLSSSSKRARKSYAELSPEDYRKAGERLSLLYCQSGRTAKAKKGLEYLGFTCRLAKNVLDYPTNSKKNYNEAHKVKKHTTNNKPQSSPPCMILDDFLHASELVHLQSMFQDPDANYWKNHSYQVEPPTPYFSYVLDLRSSQYGFMGQLARQIRQLPQLRAKFPQLAQAQLVELWAHNRPHASGHQLHFDSDDEGRGGTIRNPVCSTILYLTSTSDNDGEDTNQTTAGGPSLVTNQRLASQQLATKGWLAHPKSRRLVVFDGSVLHGVIPGKGVNSGRRVTLMMAFWKHIQIRDEPGPGSARPFPTNKKKMAPWAEAMMKDDIRVAKQRPTSLRETSPISLSTVYETLDGDPWKASMGMPDYEQVFQGF